MNLDEERDVGEEVKEVDDSLLIAIELSEHLGTDGKQ